jgi:NH3-dependent NAD+ synthetase
MAAYLGLDKQIIHREPTAGLEPGQSDFKDLGYDYDVVEIVAEGFNQGFSTEQLTKHPQILPLIEKQIKRYQKIYGNTKFTSAEGVVQDVLKRHAQAKRKLQILHPPAPIITLSYE